MSLKMTLAFSLSLCACGPSMVQGSLGELLNLTYQSVEVSSLPAHTAAPNEVAVSFQVPHGAGVDTVLEVTASLDGLTFTPRDIINLAELTPGGVQRGKISRTVFGEAPDTFPAMARGQLTLNDAPVTQGAPESGNFNVTFVDGIDFADGRTAFATFQGKIQ